MILRVNGEVIIFGPSSESPNEVGRSSTSGNWGEPVLLYFWPYMIHLTVVSIAEQLQSAPTRNELPVEAGRNAGKVGKAHCAAISLAYVCRFLHAGSVRIGKQMSFVSRRE